MDSSTSVDVFASTGGSIIKYLQQVRVSFLFCHLIIELTFKFYFFVCVWKLVSSPEDVGLSCNTAWLLGHLYSAATSSSISKTSGE